MNKMKETLFQTLQREPTYQEIADALELDVSDVLLAFEANQFVYSLDEPIYENDGSEIRLEDKVNRLDQREQLLLYYRYELGLKQEDIAVKLGVSQVQVSRLEKKIILKLREKLIQT